MELIDKEKQREQVSTHKHGYFYTESCTIGVKFTYTSHMLLKAEQMKRYEKETVLKKKWWLVNKCMACIV